MLKSVCLKEEHCMCIESSIILQSCIIWIVSVLFCLSIRNKHFLKLSMASEFKKIFSSWPSSSSLLLLSSLK